MAAVRLSACRRRSGFPERKSDTRVGNGILLEPIQVDAAAWLADLSRAAAVADELFLPEGRPEQPPMPDDDIDWDTAFDSDPKP